MVIQPGGTSVGGTAGTSSSAQIAIPPLSNGDNPKWVHVALVYNDGYGAVIVLGQDGVGAATLTNGIGIGAMQASAVINVAGNAYYRIISTGAGTHYTITPLAGIVAGG